MFERNLGFWWIARAIRNVTLSIFLFIQPSKYIWLLIQHYILVLLTICYEVVLSLIRLNYYYYSTTFLICKFFPMVELASFWRPKKMAKLVFIFSKTPYIYK